MAYEFDGGGTQWLDLAMTAAATVPVTLACRAWSADTTLVMGFVTRRDAANSAKLALRKDALDVRAQSAQAGGGNNLATFTSGMAASTWAAIMATFATTSSRIAHSNGVAGTENTAARNNGAPDTLTVGANTVATGAGTLTQFLAGRACDVGVWSVIPTLRERESYAKGFAAYLIRPQSLAACAPLIREVRNIVGDGGLMTINGSPTVVRQPRMYY